MVYSIISTLLSLIYFAIQTVIPDSWLLWLVGILPYKADVRAPGGFFLPKQQLPIKTNLFNAVQYPSWAGGPWLHIFLLKNALITGTVTGVEPLYDPKTMDWNHNTFYLKPDNKRLLNLYSAFVNKSWSNESNTLKCLVPITDTHLPSIGDKIDLYGTFSISMAWGWTEVICRAWQKRI